MTTYIYYNKVFYDTIYRYYTIIMRSINRLVNIITTHLLIINRNIVYIYNISNQNYRDLNNYYDTNALNLTNYSGIYTGTNYIITSITSSLNLE